MLLLGARDQRWHAKNANYVVFPFPSHGALQALDIKALGTITFKEKKL